MILVRVKEWEKKANVSVVVWQWLVSGYVLEIKMWKIFGVCERFCPPLNTKEVKMWLKKAAYGEYIVWNSLKWCVIRMKKGKK